VYDRLFAYLKKMKRRIIVLAGISISPHAEIDLARPKENRANTMFTPEERMRIDHWRRLAL